MATKYGTEKRGSIAGTAIVGLTIALFASGQSTPCQAGPQLGSAAWYQSFAWQYAPRILQISAANAHYMLAADETGLSGAEAGRFVAEIEGVEKYRETDGIIGALDGPMAGALLYFDHIPIGYVRTDDWHEIDPRELIESIRVITEQDNAERRAKGMATAQVLGWIQEPVYNPSSNTTYWVVKAATEGREIVNATALKLSRNGFTRVTWTGRPELFLNAREVLDQTLARYDFDPGWRYADFRGGDTVAALGLAALTRQMLTGKPGKAVASATGASLFAIAAAFVKKLWFLIFVPFAVAGRRFKSRLWPAS